MPQLYPKDDRATLVRKIAENIARHNEGKYEIRIDRDAPVVSNPVPSDIALLDPTDHHVILHIVVETIDSLTSVDVAAKWRKLAKDAPVEIAVPKGMIPRTRTICKKMDVKARLIEY